MKTGKLNPIAIGGVLAVGLTGIFLIGGDYVNRKWDGKSRFTVIDMRTAGVIESIDKSANTGIRLILPDNLAVDTLSGRGEWQLKVLPNLADKFGKEWAADSLADYLQITYTARKDELGWWDRFFWWRIAGQVNWKEVNLAETGYLEKKKEADGKEVNKLSVNWGKKAAEWFSDTEISREAINIYLVNTTSLGGLASHAALVIENTGIKVAKLESRPEALNRCVLSGNGHDKKLTGVRWIIRFFGCDWRESEAEKGDLTLSLGQEYRRWWKGNP